MPVHPVVIQNGQVANCLAATFPAEPIERPKEEDIEPSPPCQVKDLIQARAILDALAARTDIHDLLSNLPALFSGIVTELGDLVVRFLIPGRATGVDETDLLTLLDGIHSACDGPTGVELGQEQSVQ
jgi:hypothetical protein